MHMSFWILSPYTIEAHRYNISDFLPDDILVAIQNDRVKIATTDDLLKKLSAEYPNYHKYEITVGKL